MASVNGDSAADIFFRAFKDCVDNIIYTLQNDINNPETTSSIHAIAQQLNGDYTRLTYVNDVIQARIWQDETWAPSAAVEVYRVLATEVSPELSAPGLPMKGAYLVRYELMKTCQRQFERTMAEPTWNYGFINFLGQLCTFDKMTSTTTGIVLHILDNMVSSNALTTGDNFDLLMRFLMLAGPFLDNQPQGWEHLSVRMGQLQERIRSCKVSVWLAVQGVMRLRGHDWQTEEEEGTCQI
ncbi:hypothetical protein BDU57DRAFT_495542 [Ampelomyces quisqualis]|uniref:Armadillo-type protein n=1 Tax=Ampelomyces quisqualis TaxID=50730 RepID=A0A6A5QSZ2_AMPQU|nr:hypothetical protein BDU57DRAFT_495542 [Ampelomyces quisqualis]